MTSGSSSAPVSNIAKKTRYQSPLPQLISIPGEFAARQVATKLWLADSGLNTALRMKKASSLPREKYPRAGIGYDGGAGDEVQAKGNNLLPRSGIAGEREKDKRRKRSPHP